MSTADDRLSQEFLDQCVLDGRITARERDEVAVGRESSGCGRPEWKEWVFKGAGGLPSDQDCEIYINYPAWTMGEIAEHLGLTVGTVRVSLRRTRRLFPSLRHDPAGRHGLPLLQHMKPLGIPGVQGPADDDKIIVF